MNRKVQKKAKAAGRQQAPNLVTRMMRVTPQLAKTWLKDHNTNNRTLRPNYVHKLAADMAHNRYAVHHQGIAFNCDGTLIDGQHRLAAIVESGCSIVMPVTRGVPNASLLAIDDHTKRSMYDSFTLSGAVGGKITPKHVTVTNAMMTGAGGSTGGTTRIQLTKANVSDFMIKHAEAIDFGALIFNHVEKRGYTIGAVKAVIARAWYTCDRNRLREFASVILTGESDGKGDVAAVALRNYLNERLGTASGGRAEVYLKVERMLRAFLDREPLRKCVAAKVELFPIPGEEKVEE